MKTTPLTFLQCTIVLISLAVLTILLWFPTTEGRAQNLDWLAIYTDPFILYGYASSTAVFIALYKVFRLLENIKRNKLFSQKSVKELKHIKLCSISLAVLIVLAGIYIRLFHHKDDDPAGFLAMCIVATFVCIAFATAFAVLQRILQNAVDLKTENELTI